MDLEWCSVVHTTIINRLTPLKGAHHHVLATDISDTSSGRSNYAATHLCACAHEPVAELFPWSRANAWKGRGLTGARQRFASRWNCQRDVQSQRPCEGPRLLSGCSRDDRGVPAQGLRLLQGLRRSI